LWKIAFGAWPRRGDEGDEEERLMHVTFRAHGWFQYTSTIGPDGVTLSLSDTEALKVRDMLAPLNITEEEVERVVINGKRTRLEARIRNRDQVEFFPRGYGRKVGARSSTVPIDMG
jgi:hypothetical protein